MENSTFKKKNEVKSVKLILKIPLLFLFSESMYESKTMETLQYPPTMETLQYRFG
jgi:hypothetical protein